jgi:tetratricopeptide (TPR) repeat protein
LRQALIDPKEEAAYKRFHNAPEPAKKIQLGKDFINQYPNGYYLETVYAELADTYYAKQDLADFYSYSDQGISRFPDDVSLLAMNGWVIPRAYNRDDPDADKKLDRAENYEKHAIEVMEGLQKPINMSDQQFSEYKNEELAIAHSGLGLVYFRRSDYENSAKELQAAIATGAAPDPTDFYVLGADLESLDRYQEAADAFKRCGDMAGSLQDACKQAADSAQKHTAQTK